MRLLSIPASFSIFLLCFSHHSLFAQTFYYSRSNGSWKDPNTWSTVNHTGAAATNAPGETASNDIVIIGAGHVIDYNADDNTSNAATISTLSIGQSGTAGYLRFPFANFSSGDENELTGDYDLIVTGNVTIGVDGHLVTTRGGDQYPVGVTMNGTAADREDHDIFIGGNLSNAGTIDLQNDINTDYEVHLHFIGTSNQTISGSGIWDTYDITYNNTGTSNNQIINRSAGFTASVVVGRSTFVRGTYVHENGGTYNNQSTANDGTDYSDVSFVIEDGVFNMASTTTGNPDVILTNGSITVTGGRFNGGHNGIGSGEAVNIQLDGNVTVSGTGVLNIGDGNPGTTTFPTDGTLTIGGNSSSVDGSTLYTHNLVLSAGANLSIDNGAAVSVGSDTGGSITLNGVTGDGSTLTISGATTELTVYNKILLGEDCAFTINDGDVEITPAVTLVGNPESLHLNGDNASFTMLGGTLDVMANSNDRNDDDDALVLRGANTSADIQGGTVVLGNTTTGTGNIDFRQAATEVASLSISNTAHVTVGNRLQRESLNSISNITLTNNASLLVGTDNSSGNVDRFFYHGSLSISDDAIVQFGGEGDLDDVTITGSGTLETNTTGGEPVNIIGTLTCNGATASCTFYQGVNILAGASLNISAGTIDILPDATTVNRIRMRIRGSLTMNGGTINLGAGITSVTDENLLQVYDGGNLTINAGTFSILANPALASIANTNPFNMENNDAGEDATPGDGTVTVGDGIGSVNTAQLIIAPNLAAQLPSPATRNLFDMDGANSILTINSDGYLSVGGGNIGDLRLNGSGANFVMNGGNCDITASLALNDGTNVEINSGILNIGTSSSNGTNSIIYSSDPSDTTSLTLNGGTINVGDGNSQLNIGNNDNNPAFGSTTAYSLLEITGGTFNLNGAFNLDDANARLVMSGGNLNLNPQGDQNLGSNVSIFDLERGIVDMTGGTVTIVNPHAASGSGYATRIADLGNADNRVSGTGSLPSTEAITFGNTFQFGDGSASLAGSTDGFDVNLSDDHTYGSFIVNNPSGSNRQVEIVGSGSDYQMSGDLTLTAGILDIGSNTINRNAVGGTLRIDSPGHLIIGNSDGSDYFPGSSTAFSTYLVDAVSTVEYDGGGNALVALPGGADFGNLIISGSGTKTLNTTETVRDTLTLASGTFASSTNLTMGSSSTVLRSDGSMTGTIQGANAYNITYEGTGKSSQAPEWSGIGDKSLIINLDASESLTLHSDLTAQSSLTITEGTLADAGFTLTIGGDVDNSSLHTGTGKIYLAGSSAQRTIGGDGTGQFENLELDDTNGALLSAAQTVNSVLTLTDGIINTTSSELLVIGSDGSVVGGSGTSFVNGPLEHIEDSTDPDTKIFPFGSNGVYRPITLNLTQDDAVTRSYTGSLTESAPTERTLPVELTRVSGIRHYTITQSPEDSDGITSASVTINYNIDDESDDAGTLRIAKSSGSDWVNIGGTGSASGSGAGDFVAGTISSDINFTTFSDFALASSSETLNPLPVELLAFQALSTVGGVKVFWTTASETNNSHFVVERSVDGASFDEVVQVEGGGDSATPLYYEILDTKASFGTVYYHLKQVDFDETSTRSQAIIVVHNPLEAAVSIQPNPVENYQTVLTATGLATEQSVIIQVTDMTGFMVRKCQRSTNIVGGLTVTLADLDVLASGLYTITLVSGQFRHVEKLIIP